MNKGHIDINLLKEFYRKELENILANKEKPIVVYWDKKVISTFNILFTHSELQKCGVEKSFFIDKSDDWSTPEAAKSVVFFIRSNIELVKIISDVVYRESYRKAILKQYFIVGTPKLDKACENLLINKKTLNLFKTIEHVSFSLLPIDNDVFSMENPTTFSDLALNEKLESFFEFARGLMQIQQVYGIFPSIVSIGENSHNVAKYVINLHSDYQTSTSNTNSDLNSQPSQFDKLIIFERTLDPISPLLYQLTYEGLIQERYGFYCGNVVIPILPSDFTNKDHRIALNSSDTLYNSIRDLNFSKVGAYLNTKSRELKGAIDMTKEARGLSDLKKVVSFVPEIKKNRKSLEIHTLIATDLQNYTSTDAYLSSLYHQQNLVSGVDGDKMSQVIEEMILLQKPISDPLRLICIQSLCNGGIKKNILESYKKLIIDSYGFHHATTLMNLEKVGFLASPVNVTSRRDSIMPRKPTETVTRVGARITGMSYAFAINLRKSYRIIHETVEDEDEDSANLDATLADSFITYIPLSVRILQAVLDVKWNADRSFNPQDTLNYTLMAGRKFVSQFKQADDSQSAITQNSSTNSDTIPFMAQNENVLNPILNLLPEGDSCIKINHQLKKALNLESNDQTDTKLIMVAFLGGVTHAEISCLRNLANSTGGRVEFVIATTGFVDHLTVLENLADPIKIV